MLSTKFDYSKIDHTKETELHLLIKAEAPKLDLKTDRKPLSIITVIDRSGSMAGQKLDYVKKSLMKLIDHMTAKDHLACISFDDRIETLFTLTPMTADSKEKARSHVSKLSSRGSTNISGGLLEAIQIAKGFDGPTRIIVFTDGQPNVGVIDKNGFVQLMQAQLPKHITVTGFGYGTDHNPDIIGAIAEHGKGNYAFIDTPDGALSAFAAELGGLLSCYAQDLKFRVIPKKDTKFEEVLSDVDVEDQKADGIVIKVPDLYSEESRKLVVRLKAPQIPKILPRDCALGEVVLTYIDLQSGQQKTEKCAFKVRYVHQGSEDRVADQEVRDQVAIAQVLQAQIKATQFAHQGNFGQASLAMNSVNLQGVSAHVGAYASSTADCFVNNATFTSNVHNLSATLSASKSGRGYGSARGMAANLGYSAGNSMQNDLMDSFTQDDQNANNPAAQNPQQPIGAAGTGVQGNCGTQGINLSQIPGVQIGGGFGGATGSNQGLTPEQLQTLTPLIHKLNGTLTVDGTGGSLTISNSSAHPDGINLSKKRSE